MDATRAAPGPAERAGGAAALVVLSWEVTEQRAATVSATDLRTAGPFEPVLRTSCLLASDTSSSVAGLVLQLINGDQGGQDRIARRFARAILSR